MCAYDIENKSKKCALIFVGYCMCYKCSDRFFHHPSIIQMMHM